MPFKTADIPDALIEATIRGEVVPLVGSGVSKQASSIFPNWAELLQEMEDHGRRQRFLTSDEGRQVRNILKQREYLMAAEQLRASLPDDEYISFLEQSFRPKGIKPSEVHQAILSLRPSMILTTNYDKLIENAYAKRFGEAPTVFTHEQSESMQRAMQSGGMSSEIPVIFKIHGSIDDPQNIILTERNYRYLMYRHPGYRLVVSSVFLTRVVLMIGFSVDDPELKLLLERHRDALKYQSGPDFAFLPRVKKGSVRARRLREDFGVQVIPYTPSEGHPELLEFLKFLAEKRGK